MPKFKKGQSGNPNGKKKGCADKRTRFRERFEPYSDELIDKAINMARDGNREVLLFLLDRVLPSKPKDDVLPVDVGSMAGTPTEKADKVLSMIFKKTLTPEEGASLLKSIQARVSIVQADEIERRLKALEEGK